MVTRMTSRLAKRLVLASTAVVLSVAPAVLAPSAAHARQLPAISKVSAVTHEVVSAVQESTAGQAPAEPITH